MPTVWNVAVSKVFQKKTNTKIELQDVGDVPQKYKLDEKMQLIQEILCGKFWNYTIFYSSPKAWQ